MFNVCSISKLVMSESEQGGARYLSCEVLVSLWRHPAFVLCCVHARSPVLIRGLEEAAFVLTGSNPAAFSQRRSDTSWEGLCGEQFL